MHTVSTSDYNGICLIYFSLSLGNEADLYGIRLIQPFSQFLSYEAMSFLTVRDQWKDINYRLWFLGLLDCVWFNRSIFRGKNKQQKRIKKVPEVKFGLFINFKPGFYVVKRLDQTLKIIKWKKSLPVTARSKLNSRTSKNVRFDSWSEFYRSNTVQTV